MDERTIIIGVFSAIIGVYAFVFRHVWQRDKHPCGSKLVYKDVCNERSKRLEDCIETEIKERTERYAELRQDMKEGFTRLEKAIKQNGR